TAPGRRIRAAVCRTANVQGVCRPGRTTGVRSRHGSAPKECPSRLRARPRLRGARRRAPRRCHRTPLPGRHRSPRRRARGGRRPVKLVFEKSRPGRRASTLPRHDLPPGDLPDELRRERPPRLPELAEPEVVRHFSELATRTFGIDTGFYPLGSCTMKHNPRVNERVVALPGFRDLHPLQDEDGAQGALELEWRLQEILAEVTGLDAVSLQPAAGSQGEVAGLLLMRAYFADGGDAERPEAVVPGTA